MPKKTKLVKVSDLQNLIGTPGPHPELHCFVCDASYSANSGDYFMAKADTVMTCCGEPMVLGFMRTVFEEVR